MGIFGVNLDEINLDDNNNIYEDDPGITIHVRLLAWQKMWKTQSTQKKCKHMINACSMGSYKWNWCMSADEKKWSRTSFYWRFESCGMLLV